MTAAPFLIEKVLTVTRGHLWTEDFRSELEGRLIDGELRNFSDLQNAVFEQRSSKKYDGISFRNHFQVSSCINLIGVGFFGPHSQPSASYTVDLAVESKLSGETISGTLEHIKDARKGEIFPVYFSRPVFLNKKTWYSIRFTLEGPETGVCNYTTLENVVKVQDTDGDEIEFEFEIGGTDQMPEMYFNAL